MDRARDAEAELNLPPGFRFHPTDEELVVHYLCRKAAYQHLPVPIIAEVDLYKFDPWELPGIVNLNQLNRHLGFAEKALFGQREWYFFTPRDRKYPNGSRPNRAAGQGYWKATGADKPVSPKGSNRPLGIKKALVFYSGKAPRGAKTDWIMHEYRLADTTRSASKKGSLRLDDWVLCRLYNKKNAWEKMQQKQKQSSSLEETSESMEAEDTGSEIFRTPESDVDDAFPEFDDHDMPGSHKARAGNAFSIHVKEQLPKEEDDWFQDLNLDELDALGATTMITMGNFDACFNQDYFFQALGSPQHRPSHTNLPPF